MKPNCDICEIYGYKTPAVYDAKIPGQCWANLCQSCFESLGCKLGLGKGQALESEYKMHSKYEYQVIEDNGGGLTLYVFGDGGIDGGKVIFAHSSYEYVKGQLIKDLDSIDAGGDVTLWDGCDDYPQALYDDLDNFEFGWQKVVEGLDGKRTLYPNLMGTSAKLEFGIEMEK
jgi:hypothetical protein